MMEPCVGEGLKQIGDIWNLIYVKQSNNQKY